MPATESAARTLDRAVHRAATADALAGLVVVQRDALAADVLVPAREPCRTSAHPRPPATVVTCATRRILCRRLCHTLRSPRSMLSLRSCQRRQYRPLVQHFHPTTCVPRPRREHVLSRPSKSGRAGEGTHPVQRTISNSSFCGQPPSIVSRSTCATKACLRCWQSSQLLYNQMRLVPDCENMMHGVLICIYEQP